MGLKQSLKRIAIGLGLYKPKPAIKVRIHETAVAKDSTFGDYTYVSPNTLIQSSTIGRFCSIGPGTIIGYGEHPIDYISSSPMFYHTGNIFGKTFAVKESFDRYKRLVIGNDVWIGANVYIKNGIVIGDGSVIAAGAVVVKDVPAYAIVGGVPAKVIRYRFPQDIIDGLLAIRWWEWSDEELQAKQPFFVTDDLDAIRDLINQRTKNTK